MKTQTLQRIFSLTIPTIALTGIAGCAGQTAKYIENTGDAYAKGDIGTGILMTAWGIIAVPVAAMVDIVSGGGTLTPEESAEMANTIASAASEKKRTTVPTQSYTSPANTLSTDNRRSPANRAAPIQAAGGFVANDARANINNSSTSNQNPKSAAGMKSYRSGNSCVSRDTKSNSLGDFIENRCSFPVWVMWFSSSSECRTGCADGPIQPGAKSSTNKIRGAYRSAACEYPASPKMRDGSQWNGSGEFVCLSWN